MSWDEHPYNQLGAFSWFLIIILICVGAFFLDKYIYEKDLEEDHLRETGISWEEFERK